MKVDIGVAERIEIEVCGYNGIYRLSEEARISGEEIDNEIQSAEQRVWVGDEKDEIEIDGDYRYEQAEGEFGEGKSGGIKISSIKEDASKERENRNMFI